jgi:hypothetical protein
LKHFQRLLPVDEARKEPGLAEARDRVLAAVKAKDAKAVLAFVSRSLVLGSTHQPDEGNRQRFEQMLADPNDEVWRNLADTLSHGGSFTTTRGGVDGRREFCAPYMYGAFPTQVQAEVIGEGTPWVITDRNVAVHAKPDAASSVLGRLSYSILQGGNTRVPDPKRFEIYWQTVDLGDDRQGFVDSTKIWDPEGPHACFANEGGRWLLTAYRSFGVPT